MAHCKSSNGPTKNLFTKSGLPVPYLPLQVPFCISTNIIKIAEWYARCQPAECFQNTTSDIVRLFCTIAMGSKYDLTLSSNNKDVQNQTINIFLFVDMTQYVVGVRKRPRVHTMKTILNLFIHSLNFNGNERNAFCISRTIAKLTNYQ